MACGQERNLSIQAMVLVRGTSFVEHSWRVLLPVHTVLQWELAWKKRGRKGTVREFVFVSVVTLEFASVRKA